ncbi:hypothetical protein NDU88_002943 [Pleurodeles waltl]|uniref:Secreted protein n=1 Tax=Pleurodeles waltl TaxID=8319 RepID=A0AAV7RFF2_PLEWA|nr:hypothetical protein NDU88_002943 [Pleurodeles waltl]
MVTRFNPLLLFFLLEGLTGRGDRHRCTERAAVGVVPLCPVHLLLPVTFGSRLDLSRSRYGQALRWTPSWVLGDDQLFRCSRVARRLWIDDSGAVPAPLLIRASPSLASVLSFPCGSELGRHAGRPLQLLAHRVVGRTVHMLLDGAGHRQNLLCGCAVEVPDRSQLILYPTLRLQCNVALRPCPGQ